MLKIVAGYLEANDYIFFVSSNKMKGLLSVSIEKGNREVHYVRSRHEEEDIYSAIFIVEIEPDSQKVYLRHLLTGEYFPHNEANKRS